MPDKAARINGSSPEIRGGTNFRPDDAEPPFYVYSHAPMELFAPDIHVSAPPPSHAGPSCAPTPLPLSLAARLHPERLLVPRAEDCHALWDRYAMLDNIRAHSALVADMARAVGLRARERGLEVSPAALLAAGLLHDLGKTYTIGHGGNHAQLGAAWVMRETRNAPIAQAVLFHVRWPWSEEWLEDERLLLTAITLYADKRVRHDAFVSLDERFEDLYVRYGVTADIKERIAASHLQGKYIETALSRLLGVELHEHIADSGRLVQRA